MKRDDALWKAILEDLADDFMRFFIKDADELFDLSRFEFLDKELESLFPTQEDEFYPRYVDKLIKVFSKTGEENWILVHIEVQGSSDAEFSERMYTYFYRIWDKYKKPIAAFAILTDSNKRFNPSYFQREFLGTKIRYDFNSYKVLQADENMLNDSDNPFATVILFVKTALKKKKVTQEALFSMKLDLAKLLFNKGFDKSKVRAMMNFLKLYLRFGNEELNHKFEQEIEVITNKTPKTMGIEEFILERANRVGLKKGMEKGMEKGIKKGRVEAYAEKDYAFVKSLLTQTDFDNEKIAQIASVNADFVKKIRGDLKN